MILIQSEIGWVLGCNGEDDLVILGSWSYMVGEAASISFSWRQDMLTHPTERCLGIVGLPFWHFNETIKTLIPQEAMLYPVLIYWFVGDLLASSFAKTSYIYILLTLLT